MSKILEDIVSNKITLEECLQRLLIIANKTNNTDLSNWCLNEINGYDSKKEFPSYRKYESTHIVYSGINGGMRLTNAPLGAGYLSSETLEKIKTIYLPDGIVELEKKMNSKSPMYRDLTLFAPEVYKNTNDGFTGVQCTSIQQMISTSFYSSAYSSIKTRIINLLCSYEQANVNIDKLDVVALKKSKFRLEINKEMFETIVINGGVYTTSKKENKFLWNVLIPVIVGVFSAVLSGVLVYLITNVWIS